MISSSSSAELVDHNKSNTEVHNGNCGSVSTTSAKEAPQKQIKSAFMKRLITLSYENNQEECLLPEKFIKQYFREVRREVKSFLEINYAMMFNIEIHTIYTHPNMTNFVNTLSNVRILKSDMEPIFNILNFAKEFSTHIENIICKMENFETKQGGWTLQQLKNVNFNLIRYQPLRGSGFLRLPRKVIEKRACINVKNKDEFCFKWAVISAICNMKYGRRAANYKVQNIASEIIEMNSYTLNFKGLCFPLKVRDVSIFEENNPSISINVLGYDNEADLVIGPYYKTKKTRSKHINLLFLESKKKKRDVGHYVWIKNFSRLIKTQITLHKNKVLMCDACLQHHRFEDQLEQHIKNKCRKEEKPLEKHKRIIQFQNYVKTVAVPFVIYANSEHVFENTQMGNLVPHTFSYYIKCSNNSSLNKFRCFKGSNSARYFVENLIKDAKYLYINHSIKIAKKIPLTETENVEFLENNSCYICSKEISEQNKVKLHCRLTGKYQGPVHHFCAFNHKIPKKFPVIFHNLTIHDCLLFINELNNIDDDPIHMIPLTNESYVSFTKDILLDEGGKIELRFLNLISFMPFTLDDLLQNMSKSDLGQQKFVFTDNEDKLGLLLSKIVFPYNFMDFADKLTEITSPSEHHFYNKLINKECPAEDYAHAEKVWREFECKSLDDYLTLCLKAKVLLMTDIFEKFRSICKKIYNLDPCHYYETAEFSWDALLKFTQVKFNMVTDKTITSFIQQGMRGGLSQCFERYSAANNKHLSDYDTEWSSRYLVYLHANNLYSKVMSELLPDGNFVWETDIEKFSLDSIPNDSEIGYILEVDLQYPYELIPRHKSLPFCAENVFMPEIKTGKLLLDMKDKYHYVIYYKNLQQCLKHGLKLSKIHRILKFNQSDWLKRYILLNNNLKGNASDPFEINVLNLMNSGIYEKIMQRVGRKIILVEKWESELRRLGARAYFITPEFNSIYIFNENLVSLELNINPYRYMPIYLEFVISELIKYKMYSFHYDFMVPKYKIDVQLNYIDRDSFIYTIRSRDFYKDIANEIYLMINAGAFNLDNNSRLTLQTLGIMRDALQGVIIKEFIALRSKFYSLKTDDMSKAMAAAQNEVCNCTNCGNNLFKSKLHQFYTTILRRSIKKCY